MKSDKEIDPIYKELTKRYDSISSSTIYSLLKGRIKVKRNKEQFVTSNTETPSLGETEDAFLKYDCAIFTAFRGGNTLEQNKERNAMLKDDMDQLGLQYRPVMGCYREADKEYANIEYCYFVFNEKGQKE